jgi:hypothetical protein
MAHAAWIVSDMEEGSLLCPFAFLQSGDERRVIAFESASQTESVQRGEASLIEYRDTIDFWGFARDGLLFDPGSVHNKVDVLTVLAWRRGLDEPVVLRQRYVPNLDGHFRLLGAIEIAVHGVVTPEPAQTSFRSLALSGVESHPQGALWLTWTSR